jgi:hypothetical protein
MGQPAGLQLDSAEQDKKKIAVKIEKKPQLLPRIAGGTGTRQDPYVIEVPIMLPERYKDKFGKEIGAAEMGYRLEKSIAYMRFSFRAESAEKYGPKNMRVDGADGLALSLGVLASDCIRKSASRTETLVTNPAVSGLISGMHRNTHDMLVDMIRLHPELKEYLIIGDLKKWR